VAWISPHLSVHPRYSGSSFCVHVLFTKRLLYAIIYLSKLPSIGATRMPMSQEHKAALAQGRLEARSIKAYLHALDSRKPGRPVTKESLDKRLDRINGKLAGETDPLKRVDLMQSRLDIEGALANVEDGANIEELAAGFVSHASSYSDRKGISYTAWRRFGVPADVLRKAGIPETRRR